MKKLLTILFMLTALIGCTPGCDPSDSDVVPRPTPIVLGMVECPECCGDGLIDIEKESVHCPRCNGFGKLNEVEIGVLKTYPKDFVRGYEAFNDGVPFKKSPLLKFRAKPWKEGWLEAEKQSKKKK